MVARYILESGGVSEYGPFVYFMRCGGKIKIGYSKDPRKRADGLQTGTADKIRIICTISGDRALERRLHEKFKAQRISGEWFAYKGALYEFLTALEPEPEREIGL